MTINYAVERLYESGWLPEDGVELERLPNGLRYPTAHAVLKVFEAAGLAISIKAHLMFGCCRAEWAPIAKNVQGEDLHGTVIGSTEAEAAVYALAKLRGQLVELRLRTDQQSLQLSTV